VFGEYQLFPDTVSMAGGPKAFITAAEIDPSDSNVTDAYAGKAYGADDEKSVPEKFSGPAFCAWAAVVAENMAYR